MRRDGVPTLTDHLHTHRTPARSRLDAGPTSATLSRHCAGYDADLCSLLACRAVTIIFQQWWREGRVSPLLTFDVWIIYTRSWIEVNPNAIHLYCVKYALILYLLILLTYFHYFFFYVKYRLT